EEWIKGVVPQRSGDFAVVSHVNTRMRAEKVIVACGGDAGRQYGCEGDGFALAEMVGHTVKETVPALVGLTSNEKYFKQLKGVRAKGAVTLTAQAQNGEEEVLGTSRGEIQFGETGLSGICVFDLSGRANRAMKEEKRCTMTLDLFPDMEHAAFLEMMRRRLILSAHKSCEDFLNGLIHKKLIPVVLKQCGVEKLNDKAEKITEDQLEQISYMLKHWDVRINGSRPWNDAQTTSGGVELSEIDPNTMESKLHPGLYFTGEVVDVDGRCGGYNLQWAWSSGILAGRSAAAGAKTEE
ncbi:MAG: aminoacetone oxidase family FAD-binding enzyme, partial [Firmicutes bacterium]|nr:aminoacetone oxidase family FAD-binding enzyme [Bacillota bacterium]